MTSYWELKDKAVSHLYGVGKYGSCHLTPVGRNGLEKLVEVLQEFLAPTHTDNCDDGRGLSVCRVDLRDHDCCYICNATQEALQIVAEFNFDKP